MLSETSAKDLLAQAAETVEVTPRSGRALVATAKRHRNRRWFVAVGAAAVTAALVTGVALAGGPDTRPVPAPPPVASSSPTPTPSDAPGGRVGVPILVKFTEAEAVQRVQEWGLVAEVLHRFVPCRPAGFVVDQDPGAATEIAAGSTVTVFVADRLSQQADCPEGVAFDDDFRVARLLYDFSRGVEGAHGPWSPRVTLAVEDTVWATLTDRQADERDRWLLDVEPGSTPVVDVLGHLADSGGEFRVDIGPHPNCVGQTPPAARGFEGFRQLTITPTTPRDPCLDWWALDVHVNDVGQIEDVSLHQTVTATRSTSGIRVSVASHCGVRGVWVDGELWLADPPLGGHNPPPGWDENVTVGWFVRTVRGRGVFHGDGGQRAVFRLAEAGTADPNAGCE
jgi:hypothetical protein